MWTDESSSEAQMISKCFEQKYEYTLMVPRDFRLAGTKNRHQTKLTLIGELT